MIEDLELLWVRCGIYIVIFGAIVAAIWGYGHHEYDKGKDFVEAKYEAKYQADLAKAQADLDKKRTDVETQHAQDLVRQTAQDAAAARTGDQYNRLLVTLANRTTGAPPPAPGPGLDGVTLLNSVVAACSGRYSEVAGAAGSLTTKVIGLQNYLRSVGLAPPLDQIASGNPQAAGVGSRGALIDVPIQPAAAPAAPSLGVVGAPMQRGSHP